MGELVSVVSCAFCGRTGGAGQPAGRLVAGAKGVAICRDCLEVATQVMNDAESAAVRPGESDPDA